MLDRPGAGQACRPTDIQAVRQIERFFRLSSQPSVGPTHHHLLYLYSIGDVLALRRLCFRQWLGVQQHTSQAETEGSISVNTNPPNITVDLIDVR